MFDKDLLVTPDHKTAESANATEEHWLDAMPTKTAALCDFSLADRMKTDLLRYQWAMGS